MGSKLDAGTACASCPTCSSKEGTSLTGDLEPGSRQAANKGKVWEAEEAGSRIHALPRECGFAPLTRTAWNVEHAGILCSGGDPGEFR